MNLLEAGMLSGIPTGGIVGGMLCKSYGVFATIGGVIAGLFVGGFLGWLYAFSIILMISVVSVIWNAVCKRADLATTEEEYLIMKNSAQLSIMIALIGSTIVGFKEVWYNGLVLAGILAVFIALYSVIVSKLKKPKNKIEK